MSAPTCNEKVLAETLVNTGESRKTIEHIIDFYSQFAVNKIREGGFESVRILHFGIFQAKLKEIQQRAFHQALPKTIIKP